MEGIAGPIGSVNDVCDSAWAGCSRPPPGRNMLRTIDADDVRVQPRAKVDSLGAFI